MLPNSLVCGYLDINVIFAATVYVYPVYHMLQARAPYSPVIVVGTHKDRVADKSTILEDMRLVKTMYGDKDHQQEGGWWGAW